MLFTPLSYPLILLFLQKLSFLTKVTPFLFSHHLHLNLIPQNIYYHSLHYNPFHQVGLLINLLPMHMITRSKVGVLKPKAFASAFINHNFSTSNTIKQVLSYPLWKQSMQFEFDTFNNNKIWILVPQSFDIKFIRSKFF